MTPREIYKAHICDAAASAAWKRGALDGVLEAAAGRARMPLCPFGRGNAEADDWLAGFERGQQLYLDVKAGGHCMSRTTDYTNSAASLRHVGASLSITYQGERWSVMEVAGVCVGDLVRVWPAPQAGALYVAAANAAQPGTLFCPALYGVALPEEDR